MKVRTPEAAPAWAIERGLIDRVGHEVVEPATRGQSVGDHHDDTRFAGLVLEAFATVDASQENTQRGSLSMGHRRGEGFEHRAFDLGERPHPDVGHRMVGSVALREGWDDVGGSVEVLDREIKDGGLLYDGIDE